MVILMNIAFIIIGCLIGFPIMYLIVLAMTSFYVPDNIQVPKVKKYPHTLGLVEPQQVSFLETDGLV